MTKLSFINAKTNVKKLQFGVDKCHPIHVGGQEHLTPELYVDNWEVKKISEEGKGVKNLKDVCEGDIMVERADADTYLGDIISKDGSNKKNIMARKAKGHGIVKQIQDMLEAICFGPYEIEVALLLRNALLLNGILTNSEVWYGTTLEETKQLEQIDEILLRKILETPSSSPKCMLYLETGCKPIRFIIQARRLVYLQYILKEDPDSLLSKFFHAQDSQPLKNDWALTCKNDMNELELNYTYEEIRNMSVEKFKNKVNKATTKLALKFLNDEKNKLSKVLHIQFSELKLQEYLLPKKTSVKLAKFIYQARNRMLDVKANYGNKYGNNLFCPTCEDPDFFDTQQHLLECDGLADNSLVHRVPVYENLFSKDVAKIINIGIIINEKYIKRKQLLNK